MANDKNEKPPTEPPGDENQIFAERRGWCQGFEKCNAPSR